MGKAEGAAHPLRGPGPRCCTPRESETIRSPSTPMARRGENLAEVTRRFGWQACGTKAGPPRLSLEAAVWCERNASRVERLCHRLTSRVPIAPLCVKRHDHIEGLTSLLTCGMRV